MPTSHEPEQLKTQHIQDQIDPQESRIFVLCAGALAVAAITFGLLNVMNVIHI